MYNKILSNGFNRTFNETYAYGKGVYFARDASYCLDGKYSTIEYDYINNTNCQYLLYSRVIVGEICVGSQYMKVPPYKDDKNVHYETMVNDVDNPSIFSITTDGQGLPVILIQLEIDESYD